ncbi:MAG: glycogen/starch synthase [Bacteroidia bacterium]|jgi:starch synthase|nr:glycogen/starch synthase [Bacteroidia bacterium]
MKKAKVLYVSQEIYPYMGENTMSNIARFLPQGIQERGKEIRTFMPRYGSINEIRHGLHEVIRLSGINLIISNDDHPLIIKVASIQRARMQVYFIDNEDYFYRKATFNDEQGKFFEDNDERAIFFCRGVIETVRKLSWVPDIIHCQGWITSLFPFYVKNACKEDPLFENAKVVYSIYGDKFEGSLNKNFAKKAVWESAVEEDLAMVKTAPTFNNLTKLAVQWSDAVVKVDPSVDPDVAKFIKKSGKPVLEHSEENYMDAYSDFYDEVLATDEVLVDE